MHLKFSKETLEELDRRAGPRKRSALIARIIDEHVSREEEARRLGAPGHSGSPTDDAGGRT